MKCSPGGRSRREIEVLAEIEYLFPNDVRHRSVSVGRKKFSCDIVIESQRVVSEYDGSYWHRDRFDQDKHKTVSLTEAGWTVIRMREAPLPLVGPLDFRVSPYADVKACVDHFLSVFMMSTGQTTREWLAYLKAPGRKNRKRVEEIISGLRDKNSEKASSPPLSMTMLSPIHPPFAHSSWVKGNP